MSSRKILVVIAPPRCASAFRWLSCATLSCFLGCGTGVPQEPVANLPHPLPGQPQPTEPPPPTAGDVFSFLSVEETQFFNREVAAWVRDIDDSVEEELASTLADLASRGLSGSSLSLGATCNAERDKVELKRAATDLALDDTASFFGSDFLPLSFAEIREVESFNCNEYPNRTFNLDDGGRGLPPVVCDISLPCSDDNPGCGNGVCETGETIANCPFDCDNGDGTGCGNGLCEPDETFNTCPDDCNATVVCGNGSCDEGENATNCSLDCANEQCGNGACEAGENLFSCPSDCGGDAGVCGNGFCDIGETEISCPLDCG